MSKENHPNFHAVKFVTDLISSFYESLRGPGKSDIQLTDDLRRQIIVFAEHIEHEIDTQVDKAWDPPNNPDSPSYNAGRSEGHADMCAELRAILDPEDVHHWNKDGVLKEVQRLRAINGA